MEGLACSCPPLTSRGRGHLGPEAPQRGRFILVALLAGLHCRQSVYADSTAGSPSTQIPIAGNLPTSACSQSTLIAGIMLGRCHFSSAEGGDPGAHPSAGSAPNVSAPCKGGFSCIPPLIQFHTWIFNRQMLVGPHQELA